MKNRNFFFFFFLQVVGSPVVMAVKSFDTGAKTATCHMVHDHVDQHIVCQVPVDRLGTCTKKPLGAADKRLVSNWFNDGKLSHWPLSM